MGSSRSSSLLTPDEPATQALLALAAHEASRAPLELAAWLGDEPAREALDALDAAGAAAPPGDLLAWLGSVCDWDVEALARAALAIGGAALLRAAPCGRRAGATRLGGQLSAARGFVECPCPAHARGLLDAAGRAPQATGAPAEDAVDQATLLAFRAREARFTSDLLPLLAMLLASTRAAGIDDASLRAVVRDEVAPWAVAQAHHALSLALDER